MAVIIRILVLGKCREVKLTVKSEKFIVGARRLVAGLLVADGTATAGLEFATETVQHGILVRRALARQNAQGLMACN